MEKYTGYDLKDFLTDADFREWVLAGKPADHPIWPTLLLQLPEKEPLAEAAYTLLIAWNEGTADFTEDDLDVEVERILDSTREPAMLWWRRKLNPLYVAASLTFIIAASSLMFLQKPDNQMRAKAFLAAEQLIEIANHSDTIQRFQLPDSTQIELSPSARLHFSAHLGTDLAPDPKKREVSMSGKIFFDVKRNEQLPFVIYTKDVTTRVLGTSFTISAIQEKYAVEVRTGKVAVEKSNIFRSEEVLVQPNQKVVFTARNFSNKQKELEKSLTANPTPIQPVSLFEYRNTSLETVFKDLQNTYGIPIIYDEQQYKNCTISVRLKDEPFYSKLNIICQTLQTSYEVIDGEIIMKPSTCE
ncbi:FecR family protein [Dyadobacter sp. 32]|uniref:FecR family protein n=1 Tax=Dyadobacter sp. 32 TaxID=538966 RepID=UPI0011EC6726